MRSITWRIWGSKTKSDVYVSMRFLGDLGKASLHESGKCNFGYTREMAEREPGRLAEFQDQRHALSWTRPVTGQSADCLWSYVLRVVIPYSELRTNVGPERHLDRVTFVPTTLGAVATEFSFVFTRGTCPPGWPGMADGSQVLCRVKLPNNETFFVVYSPHRNDSFFGEALRHGVANRNNIRSRWIESRGGEPFGPYFRDGFATTCTDGSVVLIEAAGDY
jgi:hypothetical protein